MKTLPLFGVISMLVAPLAAQAQTAIFNDTFNSGSLSTLNGTSTPGGTPSSSSTSYDVASTKTGSCAITAGTPGFLREKLSSGTTAGYIELQALFASTPVQLVNVGDSINLTITFTNSANTLLAGGAGSLIDVGLFNSGGSAPLAGSLNGAGLSGSATFVTGGCTNWQGYVAQVNSTGAASTIFNRPVQNGATAANQDLVFSGAGTGLFTNPRGTQIGGNVTSAVTLTSGAKYTMSFTILLSAPGTVSITNNLFDANGTLLSNQGGTTGAANTYTNYANQYDGLAIGLANKGTSLNPTMDISRITITTNYYFPPAIAGLINQTVIAGTNPSLSPTVTGNPTPGLQWYVSTDGGATSNAIPGANGATLALPNVQYSQNNYQYSLVAANPLGTNVSGMTLTVIVTPSISGLFNQAVYVGSTANINPSVSGVPAPTLQWLTNGVPVADGTDANGSIIAGSTTSALFITNAQAADSGTYSLVASNSAGIVTNSMFLLVSSTNVLPVLVGPTGITVIQGNNGTFSASTYYGLPQPTLQWLDQTGTPIVGATDISLTISNIQFSQNAYVYSLVASNSVGSVTNGATLTVIVPPAITSQPTSLVVTNTQSASFTVGATGVPAVAYQWYKNGSLISSAANSTATNATFTIASAAPADMAAYSCIITNQAGTTNTVSVSLTVNSTMAATAFGPTNGASGVCYDTPLSITFSSVPTLRTNGTIKIYNVTNSTTPVDTINLALNSANLAAGISNFQAHSLFPGDAQSFSYYPVVISGTTATIYPHGGVMTSNQTYYVTIDDGAFADASGAYFAGITATNVWQFTTKTVGPVDPVNPVVNADGSADFVTVQGAVDSLALDAGGARRTINIKNGAYFEIVDIAGKTNVTLRGQSRTGTVIKYPNNANLQIVQSGTTHARMTFKVNANDLAIENLSISNSTPQGGSQAEALMIESNAKHCIVNNCEIDSRQDTILANVNSSQAYFYRCIVKGNFDYIWGGGNLYFDQCLIQTIGGASGFNLTAARTDTSATTSTNFPWLNPGATFTANGMSFVNCTFTADSGVGPVTLAGSNGTAGNNVSWYGCDFATNYIAPSASLFTGNFVFWQDLNTSNGIAVTYPVVTSISGNDARLLAATNIPTWFYGWTPQLAPNITSQPGGQSVSQGQTANFTVTATGIPNPTYQWLKNGTPISGANGTNFTIASAVRTNAGNYSVIVSNGSGSVTSSPAVLNYTGNVAPVVANIVTNNVNSGLAWKTAISDLKTAAGWSDADGDTVTLSGVTSPSANGTNVTSDGTYIYYNGLVTAEDQFGYSVSDGNGGTANGTVYLEAVAGTAASISNPAVNGGGHPTFSGSGIPGYTYGVESATSLGGPWVNAGTVTAGANGSWSFTDASQTNPGTIFYRLYYPFSAGSPPQ